MAGDESSTTGRAAAAGSPADRLARVHDFAGQVWEATRRTAALEPGERDDLDSAGRQVTRLASRPMEIGIVGEYSVGKSELIGRLIGDTGLLPVGGDPVTANVTALLLRPAPDDRTSPRIDAGSVRYLDAAGLRRCRDGMLGELAASAEQQPRLGPAAAAELRALTGRPWAELERWGRSAWDRTDDPLIRSGIAELARLGTAATVAEAFLGWETTLVDEKARDAALRLPPPSAPGHAHPEPDVVPADLSRRPDELRPEHLVATQSLIERVTLHVGVPRAVWDLGRLTVDDKLVLLDFPGIDTARSGLRDRQLSRAALATVPTVVAVVNSAYPARRGLFDLRRWLDRDPAELADAVLVALGKFDLLDISKAAAVLDRIESGEPPLREADVVDGPLAGVAATARELVGHAGWTRRVFPAAPHPTGNDRTWERIGSGLTADRPDSALGPALTGFAADGGTDGLRRGIERHVVEHGMRQQIELADAAAERLDALRAAVVERVRERATDPAEEAASRSRAEVDQAVRSVLAELKRLRDNVRAELGDPTTVTVHPSEWGSPVQRAEQRAARAVFAWPQWVQLFNAVQDGRVALRATETERRVRGRVRRGPGAAPVIDGDGFRADYEEACRACEEGARADGLAVLERWMAGVRFRLDEAAAPLTRLLTPDVRARLDDGDLDFWADLQNATDLSWLPEEVRSRLDTGAGDDGPDDSGADDTGAGDDVPGAIPADETGDEDETDDGTVRERPFPLRPGTAFAWDARTPETVLSAERTTLARHPMRVARLRREFVSVVRRQAVDALGRLHRSLAEITFTELTRLHEDLTTNRLERSAVIDAIVGTPTVDGARPDDPAAALAAVALHPENGDG